MMEEKKNIKELIKDRECEVLEHKVLCKHINLDTDVIRVAGVDLIKPKSYQQTNAETGEKNTVKTKEGFTRFLEVLSTGELVSNRVRCGSIVEIIPLESEAITSDLDGLVRIDDNWIVRVWNTVPVDSIGQ